MRRTLGLVAIGTVLLLCACAAHADLLNPSFETGDLTHWFPLLDNVGSAQVVNSWAGVTKTYSPTNGQSFLVIGGGEADVPQIVFQDVTLRAGAILHGYAAFDAHDASILDGLYNDWAEVDVFDEMDLLTPLATPWYADCETVGGATSGPWTYWSWTAPADGMYELVYSSANRTDNQIQSFGLFDAVPEPGTMALLLMGLPMAGLLRRRK